MTGNQADMPQGTQFNYGRTQRIAARDYYEGIGPGSTKSFLSTQPQDIIDSRSLENPRLFKYRYGFEATRSVRHQILDIQRQYDYSDREICWFQFCGILRLTRTEAKLVPSIFLPIAGWTQFIAMLLAVLLVILRIVFSTAPAWKQACGLIVLFVSSTILAWFFKCYYIIPARTLKQSGAVESR